MSRRYNHKTHGIQFNYLEFVLYYSEFYVCKGSVTHMEVSFVSISPAQWDF